MIARRQLLRGAAAAVVGGSLGARARAADPVNRPAGSRLKVSCCAYSYRQFLTGANPRMTLLDFIDQCAAWGLDGVELTSYYFPATVTADYIGALKRRAFLLGLDISGTAVGNNFCLPPGDERRRQCALVKEWIDHAAAMGAPVVRVFAGSAPQGVSEEQARQWVVECLEECCAHAATRGVLLALENHGGVTAAPEGVLQILRAVRSDWVGANLDTGNFRSADPYADLEQVAPYAVTVHLKTEVARPGKPLEEANLERIAAILRRARYRGYVALEYEGREDPLVAVPRALARMQTVFSRRG